MKKISIITNTSKTNYVHAFLYAFFLDFFFFFRKAQLAKYVPIWKTIML